MLYGVVRPGGPRQGLTKEGLQYDLIHALFYYSLPKLGPLYLRLSWSVLCEPLQ